MIDLETLGTGPESVVISIGACAFNIQTRKIESTFIMVCDIEDQMKRGRKLDAPTLKWWMGQSDGAKKVFHDQAKPTLQVLQAFTNWMIKGVPAKKDRLVWGNGSHFDISIMESILQQFGIEVPWMYYSVYDVRTFKRFPGKGAKIEKKGVAHNALDDAISQAEYVMQIANPNVPDQV